MTCIFWPFVISWRAQYKPRILLILETSYIVRIQGKNMVTYSSFRVNAATTAESLVAFSLGSFFRTFRRTSSLGILVQLSWWFLSLCLCLGSKAGEVHKNCTWYRQRASSLFVPGNLSHTTDFNEVSNIWRQHRQSRQTQVGSLVFQVWQTRASFRGVFWGLQKKYCSWHRKRRFLTSKKGSTSKKRHHLSSEDQPEGFDKYFELNMTQSKIIANDLQKYSIDYSEPAQVSNLCRGIVIWSLWRCKYLYWQRPCRRRWTGVWRIIWWYSSAKTYKIWQLVKMARWGNPA